MPAAKERADKSAKARVHFGKLRITALVVAALFLLVAQSAFWLQRNFFDSSRFSTITTSALTSASSRNAISQEIVDQALANRPVIKSVAGKTASNLIASILNTSIAGDVIQTLTTKISSAVTSSHQQSIVLNLTSIKSVLTKVVNLATQLTYASPSFNASQIPDQIILVNKNSIPSFYSYGLIVLWLGWLCLIGAIVLIARLIYKSRAYVSPTIVACGLAIIGSSILGLIVGPLVRPAVANLGPSVNVQIIIGNLYDAFLAPFNNQMYVMTVFGLIVAAAGFVTTHWFKAKFAAVKRIRA